MDLKQLEYFIMVANQGQITKAAKALFMEQPPLSKRIKDLENELDVQLFIRNKHGVDLTDSGMKLFIMAQEILAKINDLQTSIKYNSGEIKTILNIGTLISCIPIISPYLLSLNHKYPAITYKIWEDNPYALLDQMKKGIVELLFLRTPTFAPGEFSFVTLQTEPFYLAVPKSIDPCPEKDNIPLEQVADIPLILLHEGHDIGYNEMVLNELRRKGLNHNILCQCSNSSSALFLVICGLGATVMPRSIASQFMNSTINLKAICDFTIDTSTIAVWYNNRYLSFAARQLLKEMGHDAQ